MTRAKVVRYTPSQINDIIKKLEYELENYRIKSYEINYGIDGVSIEVERLSEEPEVLELNIVGDDRIWKTLS